MDGGLVVDIPDVTMLAVDDPDDKDRWVCKAAPHVYMKFHRKHGTPTGEVESFALHEVHSLPRRADLEGVDDDVPADLSPYLGHYHLAAIGADFDVLWRRAGLVLKHPRTQNALTLEPAGEDSVRKTRNAPYTISFKTDPNGDVVSMSLDAVSEFRKK